MPNLGLVCITASKDIRYRTVTRKRLLEQSPDGQRKILEDIYRDNLQTLDAAMRYCAANGIRLYRLPSSIFPFADTPEGLDLLRSLSPALARSGKRAREAGIRLVMHPDQFVVLSSDSPDVVKNSITILQMHADIMDLLEQPRSSWALLEIHGGKSNRSDALVSAIAALPDAIRCRLGLENDEYSYSAQEIYEICMRSGVPMVFDAHHHIVHEDLPSYDHPSVEEMLLKARATWADPAHQLVHISNGRSGFNDRQHADLIDTMPASYATAPWIEIEAKMKEDAIGGLQSWLSSVGATVG
ncbi:UV DNA damage repair endonuclease UvsE [Massilia sp. Dwa41.01b]|uniref:UV DNA damage repair endonuclease UvsE n=1 Tax=unclassified Massilia TaxID=2609279 RepID=UPI001600A99B|nr:MULTISPECIES: UV DNA damage repair endonuclease UvsE [unclassified Massilia]QNA87768.1 UV DNA damage repair endonuclease UvsE [Massilia sp. Dwa41.01b]QNA98672.1 UV DNA damage repair endonuclease UvsE [Massilia sp. Se16.2.3]